jgi:DNA polymerase type B, organellar and viral
MLAKTIEALGEGAFERVVKPLTRVSHCAAEPIGFDTEYTSKGSKLISFQLAREGCTLFQRAKKLSVSVLAKALRSMGVPAGSEVMLVSFFSLAELQFLPVKREAYDWREYGSGSLDCSFHSDRYDITIHVFDLARFFERQPLSKVAQAFGLEKLEWEREKVTEKDADKKGFREYAINDAILCLEIVRHLRASFSEYGVDPLAEKTAASTAAAVFRRNWVRDEIESGDNRARYGGMRACWGGRAEALRRGYFEDVREYDLKSAYPRAAISLAEMPVQGSWFECRSLGELLKCRGGFAQVEFRFPAGCQYPCIPQILPEAQLYALRGTEWVTLDEIRLAKSMGASIRIYEAWGYLRGTTILADYMQELQEKRANATGAEKVAIKLLANSLIGKFAQRVSDINVDEIRKLANRQRIPVEDLGRMTRDELSALGLNSTVRVGSVFLPEWNGLITGRVRAIISQAAEETDAIYIATDSVWTCKKKAPSHPDFELKRKGPAIVARTRLGMILDDPDNPHVAHHSIWKRSAAVHALQNLDKPNWKYRIRKPLKLREALRKGISVGVWEESSRIANTSWDQKRNLLKSGKSAPWSNADEYRSAVARVRRESKAAKEVARNDPRMLVPT